VLGEVNQRDEYLPGAGTVQERMQQLVSQLGENRKRQSAMHVVPGLEAKGVLPPGGDENLATARPMPARFNPTSAGGTLPRDVDPEQLLLREELRETRRVQKLREDEIQAMKLENFRLHGQVRSFYTGSEQPTELLEAAQRQRAELEAERRELETRHAELYRASSHSAAPPTQHIYSEELRSDAKRIASAASAQRDDLSSYSAIDAASAAAFEDAVQAKAAANSSSELAAVREELERERAVRKAAQARATKLLAEVAAQEAARTVEDAARLKAEEGLFEASFAADASSRRHELELRLRAEQGALQEAAICDQAVTREGIQRQVLQHIEAQLAPLLPEGVDGIQAQGTVTFYLPKQVDGARYL